MCGEVDAGRRRANGLGRGIGMVAGPTPFNERFAKIICGHWLDSIGNSIIVSKSADDERELTAVLTPLVDHPEARDRVLTIRYAMSRQWRCGNANLEWADENQQRLVWVTDDGRRSVWSRAANAASPDEIKCDAAFPWLLNNAQPEPWLPLDIPRDILYDGARVAALLDIRQMIGPRSEPQERFTHILMDHDLAPQRGDYLIPGPESPLWESLQVSEAVKRNIAQRIHQIPHEALSQRVIWSGDSEVWVGHHKISVRARDVEALDRRWVLSPKDERKPIEIARLLALYSVFDNPLSNRRNGVHLGLDPELRGQCDYELFASPLNASVPNGRYASKWPHVEWRFGSIGSYPSVLQFLPVNSVVCVNPPFTEAYLADVMGRLAELKLRFRLRIAIPIQETAWRKKLHTSLPAAELLRRYYDASSEKHVDLLHPTLLWEDPRCPTRANGTHTGYGDAKTPARPDGTPLPPQPYAAATALAMGTEPTLPAPPQAAPVIPPFAPPMNPALTGLSAMLSPQLAPMVNGALPVASPMMQMKATPMATTPHMGMPPPSIPQMSTTLLPMPLSCPMGMSMTMPVKAANGSQMMPGMGQVMPGLGMFLASTLPERGNQPMPEDGRDMVRRMMSSHSSETGPSTSDTMYSETTRATTASSLGHQQMNHMHMSMPISPPPPQSAPQGRGMHSQSAYMQPQVDMRSHHQMSNDGPRGMFTLDDGEWPDLAQARGKPRAAPKRAAH